MAVEYSEDDRGLDARVGGEFVIALESNPSTGHEWAADFDASMLALLDHQFTASGAGVGSGGTERFRFGAVAPGDASIRMSYARSWETSPARELVFQVRIAA